MTWNLHCSEWIFNTLTPGWCIYVSIWWSSLVQLTHWGWVTHICVGKLTIIGSDNDLSLGWRQAIIWTNAGLLLFGPLGTIFSEILIGIQTFSFKKMYLKVSSAKSHPFCLGLNVLMACHVHCTRPLPPPLTQWVIDYLSQWPLETNVSEVQIKVQKSSFTVHNEYMHIYPLA